ncbi:hypothetical protein GCM10009691_27630 [Brevibacterium picturae]|uniref:DUF2188 domain-containing protein n=1 Tax=Brevibacterium picturae TaxID=260553 RepID=A0ABN2C561_9MICO
MSQFVVTRTRRGLWAVIDRQNSYVVSECFETPEEARGRAEQMNARPAPRPGPTITAEIQSDEQRG